VWEYASKTDNDLPTMEQDYTSCKDNNIDNSKSKDEGKVVKVNFLHLDYEEV
jgi:hypothetical protein